jgi:hypothetical protein
LDLGRVIGEWRRTWQQTLGVLAFVIAFVTPGILMLASDANLFVSLAVLAGGLAVDALIARQVLANLNVRWTLYERGFARVCLGREVRARFEDVSAFVILPAREAMLTLTDGRTLRMEGFARSDEAAQRIDEAIATALFGRYNERLARGETVVIGPLSIMRDTIRIEGRAFDRGRTLLHEEAVDRVVPGNTHGYWTLEGHDGATARIALAEIPLPSVARALIAAPRAERGDV